MNRTFRRRDPLLLGAGALVLLAGCTHAPLQKSGVPAAKIEPVYRVQQPVGTAAGQYAVGRMELAAGRVDAAIMRFTRALQLDSALVEAHNGLGIAYGQNGRFLDAAAAFQAALGHAPGAPHLLNNLGYALMRAGRLDDAWASLDRAYRLDRTNPQTRENLVQLAAARGNSAPPADVALAPAAAASVAGGAVSVPKGDPGTAPAGASSSSKASAQSAAAAAQPTATALPPSAPVQSIAVPARAPVQATAAPASAPAQPAPTLPPSVPVASSAGVIVKPVAVPAASVSRMHGAVIVQSDQSRLQQVAPGILELRPASAPSTVRAASPAAAAAAVPVAPPVSVQDPAAIAAALAALPATLGRSSSPQVAVPPQAAASPQVILPPRAKVSAPPAARLASVSGAAPVEGFEVSNGVGIRHLAGRMARALGKLGVSVDRISDYRWFGIRRSEIHYRDGHRDAALTVAETLPVQPRFVRSTRMQKSINVRLVVGRDLSAKQVAWLGEESLLQADLADDAAPVPPPTTLRADAGRAEVVRIASADAARGWRHF